MAPKSKVLSKHQRCDVAALSDVNDPVFPSGAMEQGIAVKPSEDVTYAPAAEVTIVFPTGHAYGLRTANGAEMDPRWYRHCFNER